MVIALLFLVVAALAVLVLSNLSPVALTVLGAKTLALPLGLWVAGAIGAGAVTIVILSGLLRLSRPTSGASRRPSQRTANRFTPNAFRTPWTTGTSGQSSQAGAGTSYTGATASRTAETSQSSSTKAAWDDWEDYPAPADRKSEPRTQVRDTDDDDWANWEGYEDVGRQRPGWNDRQDNFGRGDADDDYDFDDDFGVERRDDRAYREPVRTDFEVKREPQTRQQSGSVYSYSYGRSDEPPAPAQPTAKPGEVYDADYRVITPPYRPDPEAVIPPPARSTEIHDSSFADNRFGRDDFDDNDSDDDDDWGLDDEPPRGDRPGR